MMKPKTRGQRQMVRALLGAVLLQGVLGLSAPVQAMPIILPTGIATLDYIGAEYFIDNNGDFRVDPGDAFEGALLITNIGNGSRPNGQPGQLADKELTVHFRFTAERVYDTVNPNDHIDFELVAPDDFIRFYVGEGPTKNFDLSRFAPVDLSGGFPPPVLPDNSTVPRSEIIDTANDGELWLEILPGAGFFESVNDEVPGRGGPFRTRNRAWMDVTVNNTGYSLLPTEFFTVLGLPGISPEHTWEEVPHDTGHPVQLGFINEAFAFPPSLFLGDGNGGVLNPLIDPNPDGFTFNIRGSFFVRTPIPEPITASMGLIGLAAIGLGARRRRWA